MENDVWLWLTRDELQTMEQEVRTSGSVAYGAPEGRHDDLVTGLALCVFGVRRLVSPVRRSGSAQRSGPGNAAGWT
jgi:hypothetical protein